MFGDNTAVLKTKHEEKRDHSLKIPIIEDDIQTGTFYLNFQTGIATIRDMEDNLIIENQLTQEQLSRFTSIDPMAEKYYRWSPYVYVMNNPMRYIDPNGMSTHTDSLGVVVAVYDDGDLSIYRHSNLPASYASYEGQTETYIDEDGNEQTREMARLEGGENMGDTYIWDEFRGHDNVTGEATNQVVGTIMFGENWDNAILSLNKRATRLGLVNTARSSTRGGYYDIKSQSQYAPHGASTGKMLGGKYISARSAGNFLAGMNGATGKWGYTNASYINKQTYMIMAGALHSKENGTNIVAPYYGEIPYAGRMISAGFSAGVKKRGR